MQPLAACPGAWQTEAVDLDLRLHLHLSLELLHAGAHCWTRADAASHAFATFDAGAHCWTRAHARWAGSGFATFEFQLDSQWMLEMQPLSCALPCQRTARLPGQLMQLCVAAPLAAIVNSTFSPAGRASSPLPFVIFFVVGKHDYPLLLCVVLEIRGRFEAH